MALIKCGDCGHDVSTDADACPNCGWKTPKGRREEGGEALNGCGCVMTILFAIPVFFGIIFIMLGV